MKYVKENLDDLPDDLKNYLKHKDNYLYGHFIWKNIQDEEERERIECLTWKELELECENEIKMIKEKYNVE